MPPKGKGKGGGGGGGDKKKAGGGGGAKKPARKLYANEVQQKKTAPGHGAVDRASAANAGKF